MSDLVRTRGGPTLQISVPEGQKVEILNEVHGSPSASHFGSAISSQRIQQSYCWPGYQQDVIPWCSLCQKCLWRKTPTHPPRAMMRQVPTSATMDRVAMDLMGPLPQTKCRGRCIFIVMGYFMRWAEALVLPDQEAETVARHL